jgi:hypothetical protein
MGIPSRRWVITITHPPPWSAQWGDTHPRCRPMHQPSGSSCLARHKHHPATGRPKQSPRSAQHRPQPQLQASGRQESRPNLRPGDTVSLNELRFLLRSHLTRPSLSLPPFTNQRLSIGARNREPANIVNHD